MMKNYEGIEYETPYAVICQQEGIVCLTDEQHDEQMENPDDVWKCPRCGERAEWDDDCPLTNPEAEDREEW